MAAHSRRVLRDTFSPEDVSSTSPVGNGGIWRRRQIDSILRRHALEPVDLQTPPPASFPAKCLHSLLLKYRFHPIIPWRRRSLGAAEYSRRFYRFNARRSGITRVAFLETAIDPIAIATLKEEGFKVIVALSALHSLWIDRPNQITGSYPSMFLKEIRALSHADAVFCISREELWLLNNLGVSAKYLPYYPDPERATELVRERDGRQPISPAVSREFLICGTRGNSDILASFRAQADLILRAVPKGSAVFHVTGLHTEEIRDIWNDERFTFHGTCSPEKFMSIKARCHAICLHQSRGLGSLTRIPDMLLSGLAVIANGPAARSFSGVDGVRVYDTLPQFEAILLGQIDPPPIPEPPVELENALCQCLADA